MAATLLDPVRSAVNSAQITNFTAYELDFYPKQVQMRAMLSGAGVNLIDIGKYEAFAGEVYHATRVVSGAALQEAANNLIAKWSDTNHLGASASTLLTAITVEVFHIDTAPITP